MTDWQLIGEYVDNKSEAAFSDLVDKHMKLVYGVCRREVGDAQMAEDGPQPAIEIRNDPQREMRRQGLQRFQRFRKKLPNARLGELRIHILEIRVPIESAFSRSGSCASDATSSTARRRISEISENPTGGFS